jgi:hypothetical protein
MDACRRTLPALFWSSETAKFLSKQSYTTEAGLALTVPIACERMTTDIFHEKAARRRKADGDGSTSCPGRFGPSRKKEAAGRGFGNYELWVLNAAMIGTTLVGGRMRGEFCRERQIAIRSQRLSAMRYNLFLKIASLGNEILVVATRRIEAQFSKSRRAADRCLSSSLCSR